MVESDWTTDQHGRSNSSETYLFAVTVVELILRNVRLGDDVPAAARLIVAKLVHEHGFAPKTEVVR
jgi:hypothetical protein